MNARRATRAIPAILLCLLPIPAVAQVPSSFASAAARVFSDLSAEDLASMAAGEPIVRASARPKSLSLIRDDETARSIKDGFSRLAPNYFAEFLFALPASKATLDSLDAFLSDPRKFVGIPYYSRQNGKTYPLFDKVIVTGQRSLPDGSVQTDVLQHMEPFDEYAAEYRRSRSARSFSFDFRNVDPLVYSYRNFRAAGPGGMLWTLYAFEENGYLWLYGAGGVRAFDLLGAFRSRLEASFMGRIDAFFSYAMKSVRNKQ